MPNDLVPRLEPVVAEAVAGLGFELDSLQIQRSGTRMLVTAVVDADNGVDLDEVAEISRTVSAHLDKHDHLLSGSYTLEVTSPGLERPLSAPRHWRRAKFRRVRVQPVGGEQFAGRVGHAGERSVRMLVGSHLTEVAYDDVATATVEVEFKQPPSDELKTLEQDAAALEQDAAPGEHGAGAVDAGGQDNRKRQKEGPR